MPEKPAGSFDATPADLYARANQIIYQQDAVPLFRADIQADMSRGYEVSHADSRKRYFPTQREAFQHGAEWQEGDLKAWEAAVRKAQRDGTQPPEKPAGWVVKGGTHALGAKVSFGVDLDFEAQVVLLNLLQKHLGKDAGFTKVDAKSIVLINFKGEHGLPEMDDQDFLVAINTFEEEARKDHGLQEVRAFGSEGRYGPVAAWAADRSGAELSAAFTGRPALQRWIHDRQQAFTDLLGRYSGADLADRERAAEGSAANRSGVGRSFDQSGRPQTETPEFKRFFGGNIEFTRRLDALKAGTLNRHVSLPLGDTPRALRLAGLPGLPLMYGQAQARKTLLEMHAGLVGEETLRHLPDLIADPIMVIRQENGRYGVLLSGDVGPDGLFRPVGLDRKHWASADPVRKVFKAAFAAAGLPYASPHRVRDTISMLGQQKHMTVEEMKAWSQNMGHDRIATTLTSYGPVSSHRQAELIRGFGTASKNRASVVSQIAALAGELMKTDS